MEPEQLHCQGTQLPYLPSLAKPAVFLEKPKTRSKSDQSTQELSVTVPEGHWSSLVEVWSQRSLELAFLGADAQTGLGTLWGTAQLLSGTCWVLAFAAWSPVAAAGVCALQRALTQGGSSRDLPFLS